MKTILYFLTDNEQILYHRLQNILSVEKIANKEYPYKRDDLLEFTNGEWVKTQVAIDMGDLYDKTLYRITSDIHSAETMIKKYSQWGDVITYAEAKVSGSVLQTDRLVRDPMTGDDVNYVFSLNPSELEQIYLRNQIYKYFDMRLRRNAAFYTLMLQLTKSIGNGFSDENIIIDTLDTMDNMDLGKCSNFKYNQLDGDFILEQNDKSIDTILESIEFPLQVTKFAMVGFATLPVEVYASNDSGINWTEVTIDANGMSNEITFNETPLNFKLRVILKGGVLDYSAFLTGYGFVWA